MEGIGRDEIGWFETGMLHKMLSRRPGPSESWHNL